MRGLSQSDTHSVAFQKDHNDLCTFTGTDDADFEKLVGIFRRLEERRTHQPMQDSLAKGMALKPNSTVISFNQTVSKISLCGY